MLIIKEYRNSFVILYFLDITLLTTTFIFSYEKSNRISCNQCHKFEELLLADLIYFCFFYVESRLASLMEVGILLVGIEQCPSLSYSVD